MILDFRDRETELVWRGEFSRRLPRDVQQVSAPEAAHAEQRHTLQDLRMPPANRLEALKGQRKGQWSMRVNDQWRVCFVWNDGNASEVEIVDYH